MNLAATCHNDWRTGQFLSSAPIIFFFFLGERLFSNYGAKTSLENQVKQLRDDVNDKLEYVGASLMSIASVLRDEKKPDQQLIEGETKLTEDTSSEGLGK